MKDHTPPFLNITMPVFNRYAFTQKTILALRKCTRNIPFTLTVVDNGSEPDLVKRLIEFKEDSIIDYLYLLDRNMGVSCASNIGWERLDAPYYMKLDNDCLITDTQFFEKIFKLWQHGDALSTLGGAYNNEMLLQNTGTLYTENGILGICTTNLPGHAIIIPKSISDCLGLWSEDYGLYGAEDGDYGLRMNCAGFKQYYYHAPDFLTHLGDSDNEMYLSSCLNKVEEYNKIFVNESGEDGLFRINSSLYNFCIRTWKAVRKYKIFDIQKKYRVVLCENEEYAEYKHNLDTCAKKINKRILEISPNEDVYNNEFILELKAIMATSNHDCERMFLNH